MSIPRIFQRKQGMGPSMIHVSRSLQRCNHREVQIVLGHLSGFGLRVGRFLCPKAVHPRALSKTKEKEHGGRRDRRSASEAMKVLREEERKKEAQTEEEDGTYGQK